MIGCIRFTELSCAYFGISVSSGGIISAGGSGSGMTGLLRRGTAPRSRVELLVLCVVSVVVVELVEV